MGNSAWVDFNDIDTSGVTMTLATYCSAVPALGERIVTWDYDNNRCAGVVVGVNGTGASTGVLIELDMTTFNKV